MSMTAKTGLKPAANLNNYNTFNSEELNVLTKKDMEQINAARKGLLVDKNELTKKANMLGNALIKPVSKEKKLELNMEIQRLNEKITIIDKNLADLQKKVDNSYTYLEFRDCDTSWKSNREVQTIECQ